MTTYIVWSKLYDTAFRVAYLKMTGEEIQKTPQENESRSHFVVGSSRMLMPQLTLLVSYRIST